MGSNLFGVNVGRTKMKQRILEAAGVVVKIGSSLKLNHQ